MRALAALVALAACGGDARKIAEADRADLEAALAAADVQAATFLDERTRGLRDAVAHPPELAGPCTFDMPAMPSPKLATHASLLPSWALAGALGPAVSSDAERAWARRGLEGTPHAQFAAARRYFADQLAAQRYAEHESREKMRPRIALLAGPDVWGWELVIVTEHWDTGLHGHAYLWSYDEHRMRCAGDVDAPIALALDAARAGLHELRK